MAGAARAREPHRVAYYLSELAGLFHPYYKAHRVITATARLTLARLGALRRGGPGACGTGSTCSGVSAPDSMSRGEERD